jgi:CRP-like cAMP-binding protein/di/tricarboxylate transporter
VAELTTSVALSDVEWIAKIDLFAGLDRVALAQLAAHLQRQAVPAGAAVFEQGGEPDALYLVEEGRFDIGVASDGGPEVRVSSRGPGEYFGEMALLTEAVHSATVRAAEDGLLLRLGRRDFVELFHKRPSVASAVIATMSQHLRQVEHDRADAGAAVDRLLDERLDTLTEDRRRRVLEASLLDGPSLPVLEVAFGDDAAEVAADVTALAGSPALLASLRDRARQAAQGQPESLAEQLALRLADAQLWDEALSVLARSGPRPAFLAVLGRALRSVPSFEHERAVRWVERVTDEEAAYDSELAVARAAVLRDRGQHHEAAQLIRRVMSTGLLMRTSGEGQDLAEALSHVMTDDAEGLVFGHPRRLHLPANLSHWKTWLPLSAAAGCVAASILLAGNRQLVFLLLLAAAVVLWVSRVTSTAIVALGLLTSWVLLGIAKPEQVMSGFASTTWLFVVAVLALSSAVTHSGMLFRVGLLLIRRLPRSLFGQAGVLLSTGMLLTPLLPVGQGRVALTMPLALTLSQAFELEDHEPRAAILGLAAWIGSTPLTFMFLNGSSLTLLAWGLLPPEDQARFDWIHWLIAGLPLGLIAGFGTIALLMLILRPAKSTLPPHEKLDLELAVLGRPGKRELAMMVVLVATIACWMAAGSLKLDLATIAVLGLLGAVITGNFSRRGLQELDWNFLIFFGAVLTVGSVAVSLGIDKAAASAITALLATIGGGKLVFLMVVTIVTILFQLVISKGQAVLLLGLIFVPVAATVGINAWVVMLIILATSSMWYYTAQTAGYALALSAGEGRLFTESQGRLAAGAFTLMLFLGIAVSVPYWRLLGLL